MLGDVARVVVVGGGHNGLVCATCLARAGLAVQLVEARDTVGGCASTVDALGARVDICSCDHGLFRASGIPEELELAAHGLRYLPVDPAQLHVTWDGATPWPLFADPDRTVDALARTYPTEVRGYRRYLRDALPLARLVLDVALHPPTPARAGRALAGRHASAALPLLRWSRRHAAGVLRSYLGADELVAPALALGPTVWGLSPYARGSGTGALALALKHVAPVARPEGGSGAVPASLAAALGAAGGVLRTGARVQAITCEGDGVRGVELEGGELLEADVVVSAVDPRTTFVRWLRHPPPTALGLVRHWRGVAAPDGYESKLDAVVAAPPQLRALEGLGPTLRALGVEDAGAATVVVTPSVDEMARAAAGRALGLVPERPVLLASTPSLLDPTRLVAGPEGGHVFSLEVLDTPYALAGGWEGSSEPRRWLEAFGSLCRPGFVDGVRRWRTMTPPEYERQFSLPRGHAPSFAGGPLAALVGRRPELTRYETPVRGLFLTGAATFPGAGVWGASGRNAAQVVLERHGP
jgi:phytoene dehydrogenase-like protein